MKVSKNIFRSYDIRGTYPDNINEDVIEHIGKALGTFLLTRGTTRISKKSPISIVVGQDNRKTSSSLSDHFIRGLASTGCNVIDIGVSITPIIHYLTCVKDFDVGVEVTASHNPKNFNGLRIDYTKAVSFYGEDLQTLYKIVSEERYEKGEGQVKKEDLAYLYIDYLKRRFKFSKKTHVAIDCGNGTASMFAPLIFEQLGCTVLPLYCDSDGSYPHGIPDPENKKFIRDLQAKVISQKANVGFGFDTDVDRFGVVDHKGNTYENDKLLMLFSDQILKKNEGVTIVYDVKSTSMLEDFISKWGGFPRMIRTGHPFFVKALKEGALLGGEFSGHMFFGGEYFGYDDGIFAACKVLELMRDTNSTLFNLMAKYPKRYHTAEVKVDCPDEKKFDVITSLEEKLNKATDVKSVSYVDGIRVKVTDTGWYLIRASNTSPYLSMRIEGADYSEAERMKERVRQNLSDFELNLSELGSSKVYYS